jgi:hypothetical protein
MRRRAMELTADTTRRLGAEFPPDQLEFLPKATSGGKALAIAYADARMIMARLDEVVGSANWSFDWEPVGSDGKRVKGKLTVCGVTKCDAGEGDKEEETLKSAVSDALKRCAVHFGIGRYLYFLPRVWTPYDAQKRQFTEQPKLSSAAVKRALELAGVAGASEPPRRPVPESSGDRAREAVERQEQPVSALISGPQPAASGLATEEIQAECEQLYRDLGGDPTDRERFLRDLGKWLHSEVILLTELVYEDWEEVRRAALHVKQQRAARAGNAYGQGA